jgi:two-component system chemotaxis sensor kinase CheA
MTTLLASIVLPSEISEFERKYLARMNRIALLFFAMHVPIFVVIAWANQTRPALAALLSLAVLAGPAAAYFTLENPRHVSVVHGIAAMFMGGLLVHFGQGPMQIEMHFYFFALIAMCAVFGNPLVIVAAAVTVALHHLVVWLVLPASVFNYDASVWVVAVHAAFVVLESIAACFISRSFFDNTAALDSRSADMRLLLDNVQQGFLTIDDAGRLATERSAAVHRWFGAPADDATWFDWLSAVSPQFATATRLAWDEVVSGIMPIELTLDQMPRRLAVGGAQLRVEYRAIGAIDAHARYLVIVTDITVEVERERAELERSEAMAVFERVLVDRSGFETFFEEATQLVELLVKGTATDVSLVKRLLHTLKGNCALYGLTSVATMCHRLEDFIVEAGTLPPATSYADLSARWARLATDVEMLLGRRTKAIELTDQEYADLEKVVRTNHSPEPLLTMFRSLRLEPTARRLNHFAEQAQRIAQRLEKGRINITIEDHGLRLDPKRWATFWSTFIHAVRNAVDHGIESPEARIAAGKPAEGSLVLRTLQRDGRIVIEVVDDGRGIDWDAIAKKAAKAGLPLARPEDLQHALFVDGVTTAASLSDLSGRGVGMGALLDGTRALAGEVDVRSEPGLGTTVRMTFPVSAAFEHTERSQHVAA